MIRPLSLGLMTALLCCTGCFLGPHNALAPPSAAPAAPQPPPPVSAKQITPENGHQIANALAAEIDWDQQQGLLQRSER